MFKYYTSGEYRKNYCVLQQLQILSANKHNVKYATISQYFILKNQDNKFLLSSLEVIGKQKITSEKCIKFLAFLHIGIQQSQSSGLDQIILPFLSHLLKVSEDIITKESTKSFPNFTTDNLTSGHKSPVVSNSIRTSNRNNLDRISKELYMSLHIVKPYLTYLFKLLTIEDFYIQCKSSKVRVDFNQAWVLINMLKLIQAETKNFQHVGRYYYKEYESIVVILTQCFSRDINVPLSIIQRFYPKVRSLLSESVKEIEYKFSTLSQKYGQLYVYDNLNIQNIDETVRMLEEVSSLNQTLFTMYMNKYFFSKIQHIQAPNWIETTDKEYDFVFHLWKIKNKVDTERVRRGLKKTESLFQKIKAEGSKIDLSRADISASISFVKRMEFPEVSFRDRGKQVAKPFTIS